MKKIILFFLPSLFCITLSAQTVSQYLELGENALVENNLKDAKTNFVLAFEQNTKLLANGDSIGLMPENMAVFYQGLLEYCKGNEVTALAKLDKFSYRGESQKIATHYYRAIINYAFGKKYETKLQVEMAKNEMEKVVQMDKSYKNAAKLIPEWQATYDKLAEDDKALAEKSIALAPSPDKFIFTEKQPTPLNINDIKLSIGYPQVAIEAGIEGQCIMRILIDEKGRYVKHILMKEAHPLLIESVEKYLPYLRFDPAIVSGHTIKFWVNIPFVFKLS